MATNFFQRWSSRKLTAKEEHEEPTSSDATVPDTVASDTAMNSEAPQVASIDDSSDALESKYIESRYAEPELGESAETVEADVTDSSESLIDATEDKILTIEDAADVTFDSGVASFLKQGVDKAVKKAALQKLFHSDEFNYISDMDDHTEDFSNIPTLDPNVAKQLRGWVNNVSESIKKVTDALDDGKENAGGDLTDANLITDASTALEDEAENLITTDDTLSQELPQVEIAEEQETTEELAEGESIPTSLSQTDKEEELLVGVETNKN
ncbi:DUF3306 domain-containing protein [Photobacterium frigidiphilum]|uniref:DUF3306 domain-containing protein n=1 Tax=Photobacterium frigidiphilum TaxID=264736 RepID=A0A2T3J8M0_9GAMM|nr:DUF3306 domain-containing protein [Photobacterium frigidiphilum]PSU45137.1 DUF3306 domain-containing protein [Photobacterium frigidiphilum]